MPRWIVLAGILVASAASLIPAAPAGALDLNISIGIGPMAPALIVVPGTPVYYAPALPSNYFFYAGRYYAFHEGGWFYARAYNGPWTVIAVQKVPKPNLTVPVEYYKVPPGHLKKGDSPEGSGPPPWAGQGKGPKHKRGKGE